MVSRRSLPPVGGQRCYHGAMPSAAEPRPPRSWRGPAAVAAWIVGSGAWAVVLYRFLFHAWPGSDHRFGDLYQRLNESLLILHGHDPYFVGAHISDNVPPAVSLLHLPLAELGRPWAGFASVWLSCAAIGVIAASGLTTVTSVRRSTALVAMTAVAPPVVGVLLYPGASALDAGQDQLWFMALVVVDLLIISAARTGYLVGAVASLSLWPGIFVLGVLARARRSGLVRSVVGALVVLVAGAAFSLSASWRYWTYLVPSGQISSRGVNSSAAWPVDGFSGTWNLSLNGALCRWPLGGPLATKAAWLVVALAVIALAVAVAWGLWRLGLRVTPLVMLSIGAVEVSPFAWDHHWVWVVLLLPFAAIECWTKQRALAVLLGVGILPFVRQLSRRLVALGPKRHHELILDDPYNALALNRYVLTGLVLLAAGAVVALLARRRSRSATTAT